MRNGGKGANNVHKFERYLRHGINASVATAYLPITFGNNSPSLLLRVPTTSADAPHASPDQHIHLIGTGSLLSSDPTRITAKRIILTGHPFKVHKKTATIRYLFFNRADVEYFKPVQLRTKGGRIGHIREPLGTHGYFKVSRRPLFGRNGRKASSPLQVSLLTLVSHTDDELDLRATGRL